MASGKTKTEIIRTFEDTIDECNERGWTATLGTLVEDYQYDSAGNLIDPPLSLHAMDKIVKKYAERSIRMDAKETAREIPIGSSKFGGLPDLAVPWPTWKQMHYKDCPCCDLKQPPRRNYSPIPVRTRFICQINCADIYALSPVEVLPKKGLISLFGEEKLAGITNQQID